VETYRPELLVLEDRSSPSDLLSLSSLDSPFGELPNVRHVQLPRDPWPTRIGETDLTGPSPVSLPASQYTPAPSLPTAFDQKPNPTTPPKSIQKKIQAGGPAIGTWKVEKSHSETQQTPNGWFNLLSARSSNSKDTPPDDVHTIQGTGTTTPYVTAGNLNSYSTRETTRTGPKYTALSRGVATVTSATPPKYVWTGAGSLVGVQVNGAFGFVPGEVATAYLHLSDPVTFPALSSADGSFTVEFDPSGSWSYDFPVQHPEKGLVYDAKVSIKGCIASDIEGYEAIFSYNINLSPNHVDVSVTSNPLLGWGDVDSLIVHSYSWDGEYMTYHGPSLSAIIPITGRIFTTEDATFTMDQEVTIEVTNP
jgi:hypothetical protein